MKKLLHPYILAILLLSFSFSAIQSQNTYKKLSVAQCDSLVNANENNPDFVILDVRTPGVWENDHLLGSINRNYFDGDFEQQLEALPKHKLFLIHCQSGGRSGNAFNMMKNLQFEEVYDMKGGINSWKANSKPTTSELGPKLMLVGIEEKTKTNTGSDTIHVTLTNRANQTLHFSSVDIEDRHSVTHNFEIGTRPEGAEDYTFSIIHTPGYVENDSTKVSVKSNGGDLDFNIVFKDGVVGIKDISIPKEIKVYPNPADEFIQFESKGLKIEQVSLFNINGQLVYKSSLPGSHSRINISAFKNGLYLVRMDANEQSFTRKIIIQH